MATVAYLDIDQGSDFIVSMNLENDDGTPMDLYQYTVHSQFRKSYNSTTGYNFTCAVIDPTNGIISISLPGSESSLIPAGRYLYDIEIASVSVKVRVLEGIIVLTPEITRIP